MYSDTRSLERLIETITLVPGVESFRLELLPGEGRRHRRWKWSAVINDQKIGGAVEFDVEQSSLVSVPVLVLTELLINAAKALLAKVSD